MKKISDFNNATEKYPVIYAGSATRPEFVDMPTTLQQQEGVAPMDTLPAQWWNAMWKLATKDINAFRDYVGDSITEINNLLTKFGITLEDANSEQLYAFFHNDYVQNYLSTIFVNKSGDTIEGDLHIKGNLSVDGIGEEIVSTELKVGANTITLRNGNPSALGNTELAGVVTENYDGNNHNDIISIDKNGVARVGDIDIATRILYSNNGTNFFTDEELTIGATIGENEKLRDTGNQTSSGVKIYEGVTYSNDDTQAIATREDAPVDGALIKWDAASKKFVSVNIEVGVPVGTLISQYKKVAISGYLYCDGSTFDKNAYPALYMYLGTNVLPDYRECVMVGAEQNTTDTIATHDVYGEGEFKDDQMQRITGSFEAANRNRSPDAWGAFSVSVSSKEWFAISETRTMPSLISIDSAKVTRTGDTNTTHGKQKAVYVYIKATSGLA